MTTERTLIIIPTYNERENVPMLVQRILSVVPDADILLVDDQSPDATADDAEERFAGEQRFSVMRRQGPRGLGRSYADGYRYALANGYARLVQMDADFSHDPESLPVLIAQSVNNEVVIGSRYCEGGKGRQLAPSSTASEPLRQPLRFFNHRLERPGCDQRLSLL